MEEITEDRSQKTFWKTVNSRRKKREYISEDIKEKKSMEHFEKVYPEKGEGRDPILDLRLEAMEESWIFKGNIQIALSNMKKGKARGGNGIPN